ncbi:LysR family transcriptional regulator [Cellvibrio japonicus]|uniref:Transcriptional regulator, LysR family n=1 Tax=Cellvibrio japonicus (strain Ueda107) TaxID=498211 RepID=B3PHX3_CELJU|nr:LysR family transcriptional regulator [Cellvibrio japonicus]ACE85972.1 transcriptional regulator, LysR family [Cellvibrio japonicus Ueda107]QEI13909.1 LysR family transcriptional regulator [Cellvibrio japonicus]QEI17483.1 LysR family transcriptional regulator [Cellvibrio japonicus]QEI21059.1 LysR family transcriptional regulator [Cellvibrio japonicus]
MNGAFHSETLAVFLAVLDTGSFSAAARRLGRVPSAVSMAIANLEAELALELFDRRGREPKPTAQARALEPQVRLLMSQLQQLNTQALELSQGLETRLTLVIAPELQSTPWVRPLQGLTREYPSLEVQIITAPQTDALSLLHQGGAQLALVFERPAADGRESFQEVGRETLVAVIARQHPLLQDVSVTGKLKDTQLRPLRQVMVGSRSQDDTWRSGSPFCVSSEHYWRVDHPEIAVQLVLAGLGWAWLPRACVQPYINGQLLVELPMENFTNGEELWIDLVWSRERPLGLGARRFIALMEAQYRDQQAAAPHH